VEERVHADIHEIGALFFSQIRLAIPIYQRPYVWTMADQWEPLWGDIRELAEQLLRGGSPKPHFLGAVVIDNDPQPVNRVKCFTVVDGQQRLTTIQVFLEALADNYESLRDGGCKAAKEHAERARAITRNQWIASPGNGDEFKVWPMNIDQKAFKAIMSACSPSELQAQHQNSAEVLTSRIAGAYTYFYERISEWLHQREDTEPAIETLFDVVNSHMQVVVIDLRNSVDPQLIFETLNARNTPLTASDLVKNYLFHRAARERASAELYPLYWQPFEDEYSYWNATIGKGNARTERLNVFMHHYLTMKVRADVQTGRKLYGEYRSFAESTTLSTTEQLAELKRYGEVYRGLDRLPERSREGIFMARLRAMDNSTVMPFMLALTGDASVTKKDRATIVGYLESYLVRRMVCNLTSKAYNRVFVDLLKGLDETGITPDAVRDFMLGWDEDTNRWPGDEEFRAAWLDHKIYNQLAVARLRMVFLAVEPYVRSEKSEDIAFVEDKLSVEHLLPQNWQKHYPLPNDGSVGEIERGRLLHTFGNLTLLTTKLNSSVSDGPWRTSDDPDVDKGKRAAILKDAALGISRMLVGYPDWDDKAIRKRGEKLFAAALKVWPRPVK
jgi:hypothetical protein